MHRAIEFFMSQANLTGIAHLDIKDILKKYCFYLFSYTKYLMVVNKQIQRKYIILKASCRRRCCNKIGIIENLGNDIYF